MTDDAGAAAQEIVWDGWTYPYIPGAGPQQPAGVSFHDEVDDQLDGITYEVLRFALWNVNVEHGNTLVKISGSPIAAYGHDFNPVILDERGDYVFFGPFLQYLSAAASSGVKWTLEHRGENPGIEPGDIFLCNDPWIGATHQQDVAVLAPVFVDDRLFAWVCNSLHQWDLGGTAPGGFNPASPDVFWEPICIPPTKIVERGRIRKDVEELFTHLSRVPDLVALDLRAEITGARVAVERMQQLCARYGAATVKATMRKLQDDSEKAFVARLETIPDGTWTAEAWMEAALPGDRGVYRNRLTLTKEGSKLVFTNYGSAEQTGALSATYAGWRGAVVSMLVSQLLFDQMFVIEGALRHCEFRVEPGLLSCATRPAAVSGAPANTLLTTIGLGGLVISKMLATSSDADLRTEVQSCMGALSYPINAISGVDQRGNPYVSFFLDPVGAALAALSWRDGQDTGGWPWDLQSTMPNVEDNELFYPLLYLWRKELPDSGGAGRYRGGNAAEWAFIPHKTDKIVTSTVTSTVAIPGPGLFGGFPTSSNKYQLVRGADVHARLARGEAMPTSVDDLGGDAEWIGQKSFNNEVLAGDAWVCAWASASGYGDPLLREPERVEEDVVAGRVTEDWARRAYGVVVGDGDATAALRTQLLTERLGHRPERLPAADPAGRGGQPLTASLEVVGGQVLCRHCGHDFGPSGGNWKAGARRGDVPVAETNPHLRDPGIYIDAGVAARHWFCPSCGVLADSEIAVGDQAGVWDIRLGWADTEAARQL